MDGKGLWITTEIMADTRLNANEKFVLAEIQNLAQCGEVWATNKHFATICNVHEKHVSRMIRKLIALDLITLQIIYKPDSKEVDKRILTPQQNVTTPPQNVTTLVTNCYDPSNNTLLPPSNNMLRRNNKSFKKQVKKQIKDKNIFEQEFETLWNIYPNKKGRDKALTAYIKSRSDKIEYETIKNGLERYVKYVQIQQTEKHYIKHGSTWFNQHSWQDDYSTADKKRISSFMDLYDNNFGKREDDLFEFRGNDQIIDVDPNLLPYEPQKF